MLEKDFPVILICWGKEERCQIVPVVITDPTDEVTAWQTISQEYYAHKGSWTKYLPWCCVNKVEIADISIAGKKLAKGTGNEYVGIYHTEDLVAKRKHLEQVIADYKPREWFCPYDISTGTVDCVGECVERCMDNEECSERIKYKAERELSLLSLRPILTQCFFRADIAAHNSLLNSEGLIHGHTDILGKLDAWHCPESGEIRFRGLMIRNYWECNQQHALLIIIHGMLVVSLLVC
nr:hypothetical protein ANI_1_2276094 [Aspergillus niger CBS 513.88]|eukprot:XP_001394740.2 hypothetical protein ANI_1_2276094 [Aspergillus niger CBS 513.88]